MVSLPWADRNRYRAGSRGPENPRRPVRIACPAAHSEPYFLAEIRSEPLVTTSCSSIWRNRITLPSVCGMPFCAGWLRAATNAGMGALEPCMFLRLSRCRRPPFVLSNNSNGAKSPARQEFRNLECSRVSFSVCAALAGSDCRIGPASFCCPPRNSIENSIECLGAGSRSKNPCI